MDTAEFPQVLLLLVLAMLQTRWVMLGEFQRVVRDRPCLGSCA